VVIYYFLCPTLIDVLAFECSPKISDTDERLLQSNTRKKKASDGSKVKI
jgi:hypothetical protein